MREPRNEEGTAARVSDSPSTGEPNGERGIGGDVTFPKADLVGLAYGEKREGYESVLDEVVNVGRWSVHHRQVFKYDGGFYETRWSEGATESQFEEPYEFTDREVEPGRIKVTPVHPEEHVVIVYVPTNGGSRLTPSTSKEGPEG